MPTLILAAALALLTPAAEARTLDQRLHELPRAEYAFQALNIADVVTTIDALHHGYSERNPILGRHPSDAEVIGYNAGVGLLHVAGTMFLQDHAPRFVKPWEIFTISVKGGAVMNNIIVRF